MNPDVNAEKSFPRRRIFGAVLTKALEGAAAVAAATLTSILPAALLLAMIAGLSACVSSAPRADLSDASWVVIGPFPNPQDADLTCPGFYRDWLAEIGGEPRAVIEDTTTVGGRHAIRAAAQSGVVDFNRALAFTTDSVAYAYLAFDSRGGDFALRMGSDDGIRAWLNGRLILDHHVHRSLNSGDEAVAVSLAPGANRLLVKVDQGGGDWSMSCRLVPRSSEQAAFGALAKVGLAVIPARSLVPAGESVSCSVRTDPAFGLPIPVIAVLRDENGREVSRARATTGEVLTFADPEGDGLFEITATLDPAAPADIAGRLVEARGKAACFRGDPKTAFARRGARVREEARRLAKEDPSDERAATLEFLADRLEGRLHPTLESFDARMLAVGFASDILQQIAAGSRGPLTGYRQYAYRSRIDGTLQPYCLYLPDSFDPGARYGLIVAMHGFTGDDWSGALHLAKLAPVDFIIVSPFGRGDVFYRSVGEQDVLDVIDLVASSYPVDPDRVYLTGISMGGLGTWRLGELYADRFAAVAPFCGWTGTYFLDNLRSLPVLAVHGDSDPTVPVAMDRQAARVLKDRGFDVRYDELPGVNHDAWGGWSRTRDPRSIFDWFRARRRQASPVRVTATIPCERYGRQYWIRVDELAPADAPLAPPRGSGSPQGTWATVALPAAGSVDARRSSTDTVTITTKGVRALSVDLSLAGLDSKLPATIVIDGTSVPVPAGASGVPLFRDPARGWGIDPSPPAPLVARHTGGGIADLFTQPLLIVYGTQDPDRRAALEQAARRLADWSAQSDIPIGVKTGPFAVAADTQVGPALAASRSILLIGTEQENSATRMFAEVIRAFYAGGEISIQGRAFPGQGLALTTVNPRAPRYLLGYIDAPKYILASPSSIDRWFRFFPFRFTNNRVDETASWPGLCPDVMVLTTDPFSDAWSGWFDRNWKNLQGR